MAKIAADIVAMNDKARRSELVEPWDTIARIIAIAQLARNTLDRLNFFIWILN